jgi:hypothetical protein
LIASATAEVFAISVAILIVAFPAASGLKRRQRKKLAHRSQKPPPEARRQATPSVPGPIGKSPWWFALLPSSFPLTEREIKFKEEVKHYRTGDCFEREWVEQLASSRSFHAVGLRYTS